MRRVPKYRVWIKFPDGTRRPAMVRGTWTVRMALNEGKAKSYSKAVAKGKRVSIYASLQPLGIGEEDVIEAVE